MGLDAIGIVCKDLQKSVAFYSLLGVELLEAGGAEHLEGVTKSGVRIMLDSEKLMKEINPSWVKSQGNGITLCFLQESSNAVDTVFNKIIENGFSRIREPWDAFWGQRYASVLDPDGNQIDIFAPNS